MAKILSKIVDKVIFPAASLVVGKVVGMYIAIQSFGYDWHVKNYTPDSSFFTVRFVFDTPEAALNVNTFSNMFMFGLVFLISVFVVMLAVFLHASHQNPRVISQLAKLNLLGLIRNTQDILTDAMTWFTALWISSLIIIYSTFIGSSFLWIAPVSFVLSLILSAILISDLDKELTPRAKLQ